MIPMGFPKVGLVVKIAIYEPEPDYQSDLIKEPISRYFELGPFSHWVIGWSIHITALQARPQKI